MPSPPAEAVHLRVFDAGRAHDFTGMMRRAAGDIGASFRFFWCWRLLALHDIRRRYPARSLGPIWITLHSLLMISAIGLVLGRALNTPYATFLPYLAVGWVIWQFIAGVISESPSLFLDATLVAMTPHPLFAQVLRLIFRNLVILACNIPVAAGVFLCFRAHQAPELLQAMAGLALLAINATWIATLIGLLGARYRDIQQITAVAMQPLFFLTPVLWPVKSLGSWSVLASLNPFYYVLESVRGPLLGEPPPPAFWAILVLAALGGSLLAFAAFARFRGRIAYWL